MRVLQGGRLKRVFALDEREEHRVLQREVRLRDPQTVMKQRKSEGKTETLGRWTVRKGGKM